MATMVATFMFSTFAGILAPFRRAQTPRALKQPTTPAVMDAATYAAMLAEAERIAAPYRQHIAALQLPDADLQEREAFDMYGVDFPGHPNLVRVYMWDEFEGFPMRKDFPKQGDKYIADEEE